MVKEKILSNQLNLEIDFIHRLQKLLNQEVIKGQLFNFGKFVLCDISSSEHGLWTEVDGGKVWTLAIEAKNAKGISLYYDDFWIPSSSIISV